MAKPKPAKPAPKPAPKVESYVYNWRSRAGLKRGK